MNFFNKTVNKLEENPKWHFGSFCVILIFLSLVMIFSYGLSPSHDFFFHFKRLNVLMDALSNGTFPVYIDHTAANGYGYITKWFYSDVMLIPFAAIGLVTNAVFAYQFMWFSMTVLCGLFMYYAVNRIYKNPYAASISAILFTFAAYRLLDVYNRSAVGEALSFTFVPIVFLGLYEIIKGNYNKWYILAIGYSLMIFTHVLSTFLMFVTTVIVLVICYKSFVKEPKRFYYLLLSGVVTLFLTAYFLFPMLEQMLSNSFYYQTLVKAHPDDHKKGINWIIWGMFSGVIHPKQIFIPGIGILLTWAISLRLFVNEKSANLKTVDVGVIIGLVLIVLLSSLIPWTVFPFNKLLFIQLPWRLYEFISFFFALAGGYYLSSILKSNKRRFVGTCLLVLFTMFVIISSGIDFRYETKLDGRDIYEVPTRETNNYHLYGMEYIPSKVPSIDYVEDRGGRVDVESAETIISDFHKINGVTSFHVQVENHADNIELPLFYYKGYAMAYSNDKMYSSVKESKNGLIEIPATRSGQIIIWYEGTVIQKIAPYISLFSMLLLCIYIFVQKRKRTI